MEWISNPNNPANKDKPPAVVLPKGPLYLSYGMGDQHNIKRLFGPPTAPVLRGGKWA